jgi:hypothetical protein
MVKLLLLCFLLAVTVQLTSAQAISATGTVKDEQGNPVRFAFIRDRPFKSATFSDSLGNFKLMVNPNSTLQITGQGYSDATINTTNNTTFEVVLKHLNGANAVVNGSSRTQGSLSLGNSTANQASQLGWSATMPGHKLDAVHGSRYFFDDWAYGFVIDDKDSLVQYPSYLYNYDKIGGGFLYTQDTKTAMEINRDYIKSFTLFSSNGETAVFEKAPDIDKTHYVQVLASGKKYKIYKLVKTDFVKSNYSTNGITSQGNNYDEYVNSGDYYVLNIGSNQLQKFALRKKVIKLAFAAEADKINKFLTDNSADIDDAYLSKLGDYMNN